MDKSKSVLKWRCTDCGETFESDVTRHNMDYCPNECGWVDHEESYIRTTFNVEAVGDN